MIKNGSSAAELAFTWMTWIVWGKNIKWNKEKIVLGFKTLRHSSMLYFEASVGRVFKLK